MRSGVSSVEAKMSGAGVVLMPCLSALIWQVWSSSAPALQVSLTRRIHVFLLQWHLPLFVFWFGFFFCSVLLPPAAKGDDPTGNHTVCSLTPSFGALKENR